MLERLLSTYGTSQLLSALRAQRPILTATALDGVRLNTAVGIMIEGGNWSVVRGRVIVDHLPDSLNKRLLRLTDFEELPDGVEFERFDATPEVRYAVEATRLAFGAIAPGAPPRESPRMISTDGSTITVSIAMPGQDGALSASWYDNRAEGPLTKIAGAARPIVDLLAARPR